MMMYRIYWIEKNSMDERIKCSVDVVRSRLHERIDSLLESDRLITGIFSVPAPDYPSEKE